MIELKKSKRLIILRYPIRFLFNLIHVVRYIFQIYFLLAIHIQMIYLFFENLSLQLCSPYLKITNNHFKTKEEQSISGMSNINPSLNQQIGEPLLQQNSNPKLSEVQQLIDRVNGQGKYQIISFLIFGFMWFVTSWLLVGQAFFFDNSYTCKDIKDVKQCQELVCNLSSEFRPLNIQTHADSIVFNFTTYLICDFQYVVTILQSMLFIGSLIGFFVIPYVADNFGRKVAIQASWGICTLGVLAICFADSPNMIGIGYFFAGFGSNPAITLCFSFINQNGLGKTKSMFGVAIQIFLAIGQSTIGIIFLSDLHWYQVGYILLLLCLIINGMLLYLTETPKFLLKKNKKLALKAFNTIANRNGRGQLTLEEIQKVDVGKQDKDDSGGASITDLFFYKSLRWRSIASGLVFLAIQVIYYSTSLNLDAVGDNKLLNQEVIGISQGISYVFAEVVVSKVYRKKFTLIGITSSAVLCLLIAFLTIFQNDDNKDTLVIIQTIMLLLNRFVLCSSWAIFYVYIGQLFPTRVRSLGFGWASAVGTVGSAASPYFRLASNEIGFNPWIIPGVIGLIGAVSICCLPQTFNLPSQDQIVQKRTEQLSDDQDEWSQKREYFNTNSQASYKMIQDSNEKSY